MQVDWARMVRPQPDGYGTDFLLAESQRRFPHKWRQGAPSEFHVFGGVPLITMTMAHHITADLDHPNIARGDKYLKEWWPEQWDQCAALLTEVWPIGTDIDWRDDKGAGSCSSSNMIWGSVGSSVHGALGFCEGVIHELGHWKLRGLGLDLESWDTLCANSPDEMFESPVRKDKPRPMGACIHAQYSFLHVLEVEVRARKTGYEVSMMRLNRDRMAEGRITLEAWRPQPGTEAFKDAMQAWADELVAEASELLGL